MKALSLIILLCTVSTVVSARQLFLLRGTVTDSTSGEPLGAANVRVLSTSKGTITNAQGSYSVMLEAGSHEMIYSYLGYEPETLIVHLDRPSVRNVQLRPSPIRMSEVVVFAEDPALEIIRNAIRHKHEWMEKLRDYSFKAFTRQTLMRDTAIAGITEAFTEGFQSKGDTLREVVRQRRQTQNVPMSENFASVRRIVNFNEDRVELFSMKVNDNSSAYTFVGPTASDALDNYEYKLLKVSRASGHDVYSIRMQPKSRLKPLFDGVITIADGTFAVMGIDVRPNDTFVIPFIKNIELRYQQGFALYDSLFWMPTDIRIAGGFSVSIVGLTLPRVGIDLISSIYDYSINQSVPDSILSRPHLTIDSSASKYDSTFWSTNQILPLTQQQQHAYRTLDSTATLEKQFQPKGPLMAMSGNGGEGIVFDHLDARFNRAEGVFLAAKHDIGNLSPYISLRGALGYGFSDHRLKYEFGSTLYPWKNHRYGVGGEWYTAIRNVPDQGSYGPLAITFMALIDKNDYRDYYLAKGGRVFLTAEPNRWSEGTLSFVAEQEYSLGARTAYSLFSHSTEYRPNPRINDGAMRSFRFDIRLGEEDIPLDLVARNALELSAEHSWKGLAGSEFDFTRWEGILSWHVNTFARELLFPPLLRVRLSGGIGTGSLPLQRTFTIDTRSSGYAQFGVLHGGYIKEFVGDRYVMLNIEHNFRSVPFILLDLPFLYKNGIEFIVHTSFAQTWTGGVSGSDGWYSEAGVGINKILDLIRMDLTYRTREPERLFFTVSVANLF